MSDWTDLGFRESWTCDYVALRASGFPLQVFHVHPRISDVLCGLFIGWEEDVVWWRQALNALPHDVIARARIEVAHHQNSGTACRPFVGQVATLAMAKPMMTPVTALCRHYYRSQSGAHTLPNIDYPAIADEYRTRVARMGLTANHLSGEVREGIYPLDATQANFDILLAEKSQVAGALEIANMYPPARERLRLFILADNSD